MSKIKCSHCQSDFEKSAMIRDGENFFCCPSCQSVYKILNQNGFEEFYKRLGKTALKPAKEHKKLEENFDAIYQNYVKNENGFSKISLIIEGIHCAACIWLNEKALSAKSGILEVNINSLNNKAVIIWDDSEIKLSEIFATIRAIGYNAYAYEAGVSEERLIAKRREFYAKLLVGIFCTMNIMWLAVAQYGGYFSGMQENIRSILNFAEFILATPVLLYTGSDFWKGAYNSLRSGRQNMDSLIISGTFLAYLFSIYAMFSRQGEVYFDSVAMIITFIFIGKYLEILSKKRAGDTLDSLNSMIQSFVSVKIENEIVQKSVNDVVVGDIILLNSGSKALIDGVIVSGEGSFDLSSLSGESAPVWLNRGAKIKSGSICLDGVVEYKASAIFSDSMLCKIINLLENAVSKKPKIGAFADTIASKFSTTVFVFAVLTFCFWLWQGYGVSQALIVAISVVVISCPCALGLATPVSTLVALGAGFKKGILFKEAKIIETLAKCDLIVFDKTGTLTNAKLEVKNFEKKANFDINLLFSLLSVSNHPVSVGVIDFVKRNFKNLEILNLQEIKSVAARGVQAKFGDMRLAGGNYAFMNELGIKALKSDYTSYYFSINENLVAVFELEDSVKFNAKESIAELKKLNMDIVMLTGDNEKVAQKVAQSLGIENFIANVSPLDKAEKVENLIKSGKNVVMVGDGVNDAPALSLAGVAVCMGSGADVSIKKSDVVLLKDDLHSLVLAVKIAKRCFGIIRQNLAFSLFYNLITIPLAMAGYVVPVVAAISMSLSSIIVVLNAMRVKKDNI
ncbi:MAG: heavy metal translocating P-type ATPase [Campylobacter sp.]